MRNVSFKAAVRLGWLLLLLAGGCIQPPAPTPVTHTPQPTSTEDLPLGSPTALPATVTVTATLQPGPTPSMTHMPTVTVVPTEIPTPTATAVSPPPTHTPTVTPVPTSIPSPTISSTPSVVIDYFRANVDIADPGDTVTLSWATHNAAVITLYRLLPSGQLGTFWDVEAVGNMNMLIDPAARNSVTYMLFAGEGSTHVQATVTVPLTCPDVWFFTPAPDECPARPALISDAAYQPFERGHMIWVKEMGQIYILFADGNSPKWSVLADRWQEGDPIDDPQLTPPDGLYQPVRGFGLLWRTETGLRDRLGWAIGPEVAYQTAWQTTSRWKYNEFYLRAADGRLWHLLPEGSDWRLE